MSIDQPVGLTSSNEQSAASGLTGHSGRRSHEDPNDQKKPPASSVAPSPEAKERFQRAMTRTIGNGEMGQDRPPSTAAQHSTPFELFGAAVSRGTMHAQPAPDPGLQDLLRSQLERLMVEQGSHGARQVRMDLKTIPGVTVIVREAEGRLQVEFICSNDAARHNLNTQARVQAHVLAQRLNRNVLIRVQTDDEEWPCLNEASGHPEGHPGTRLSGTGHPEQP